MRYSYTIFRPTSGEVHLEAEEKEVREKKERYVAIRKCKEGIGFISRDNTSRGARVFFRAESLDDEMVLTILAQLLGCHRFDILLKEPSAQRRGLYY